MISVTALQCHTVLMDRRVSWSPRMNFNSELPRRQRIFQILSPSFWAVCCVLTPLLNLAPLDLSQLFHKLLLSFPLVAFFLINEYFPFPLLFRVTNIHRLIFFRGPNIYSFVLQLICLPSRSSLVLPTAQVETRPSEHKVRVPAVHFHACSTK